MSSGREIRASGCSGVLLAGVDEVGRGPLAGDVLAAAVIFSAGEFVEGLADSKKLSPTQREILFDRITLRALSWSIGRASVDEIDRHNILQATLMAMCRAVEGLTVQPRHVLVDGNRLPCWNYAATAVVGGDASVPAISAAAIVAKVTRDREMIELDRRYPQYGFARHKGYGTAEHLQALARHGACPIHRRSFRPVRAAIEAIGPP